MVNRLLNLPKKHSFFLFGARGTGKTSLLKKIYSEDTLYIDLLNLETEAKYQLNPELLYKELALLPAGTKTVIVDEIQKVPKLLDVVHRKIEESELQFILTGSSARKLKRGTANLLAGRAFVFHLFPFLAEEIHEGLDLNAALNFGTLPRAYTLEDEPDKKRFLKSYANTYLKEEVWGEHLIRKIEPFRNFLKVAAQSHGQIVNYSKISKDVGVDDVTVKSYYSILEDTLLGYFLPAYTLSARKQLKKSAKFYLFDNGVKRALDESIDFTMVPKTFEYGIAFENFIISEIMRRFAYREITPQFHFLATAGGLEIDLLISHGNKVKILLEIKSANTINTDSLRHLKSIKSSFLGAKAFCFHTGMDAWEEDQIAVLPWEKGVREVVNVVAGESG